MDFGGEKLRHRSLDAIRRLEIGAAESSAPLLFGVGRQPTAAFPSGGAAAMPPL